MSNDLEQNSSNTELTAKHQKSLLEIDQEALGIDDKDLANFLEKIVSPQIEYIRFGF